MTTGIRVVISRADFLVGYVVAMHALMFANLFLAGRSIPSPVLLPFAVGTLWLTVRFFAEVLRQRTPSVSPLDLAVSAYLAVSLVSLVQFVLPGNPASPRAYLYGLSLQVVPMLMYFAGRCVDAASVPRILAVLVAAQAFCALVGIPLFFTRPDFYSNYLVDRLGYTADWQTYARLQSYMGSTATGILSAVAIVLLANLRMAMLLRYGLALLFLLTIFLTQQRGAYVSGVLAFAYLVYRSKFSVLQLSLAAGATVGGVLAGLASLGLDIALLEGIMRNRIVEDLLLGSPLGERLSSWDKGLAFLAQQPLGLGLGATTSAAQDAGAHVNGQVVDAYYMRVAADLGVHGAMLFVLVLVLGALQGLGRTAVQGLVVVVAIYAFQSIGTNVLDSFFVSHAFWLLLGLAGAQGRTHAQSRPGRLRFAATAGAPGAARPTHPPPAPAVNDSAC
jgi:hypothetical protein